MVLRPHMARQARGVGENVVVTDRAIVSHMAKGHQVVMIADDRSLSIIVAAADIDVLFEVVVVADDKGLVLTGLVAQVLRLDTDRGAMADPVEGSHPGGCIDAHIAVDHATLTDDRAGLNDGIGSDTDA